MQKSTLGLLRSLLCDLLNDQPELGSIAFPTWHPNFAGSEPVLADVAAALTRILKQNDLGGRRTCLLIDGLD